MFRKLYRFPSSGEGKETPTVIGSLERSSLTVIESSFSKWPNRVGVSLTSQRLRLAF
jgi:hypothetical protein